jgi:hypothetical protein
VKVLLPSALPALANIERQLKKFTDAAGHAPPTFPVFGAEFRRAAAEIAKKRPAQRKKYHLDGESFLIGAVEIVPMRGPFFWRAGIWCHHSIAWEIRKDGRPAQVMRDLEPYKAVAGDVAAGGDAPVIGGRAQHREFLKRNGYVELGNEIPKDGRTFDMPSVSEDLQRAMQTGMTPEARDAAERAKRALDQDG